MRLFHVSEEADIHEFKPRIPQRKDLDPIVGLVWAIDDTHLSNFLTHAIVRVSVITSIKTPQKLISNSFLLLIKFTPW